MNADSTDKRTISWFTATCLVVANMIGTGVFTSLGFQVGSLPSGFVIGVLWLVGGISALCGALCYAELATALPRSGGEYHFVGRSLHPALGFLAGWLSATVGFAAPIALAAMALGRYAAEIAFPYPSGIVVFISAFDIAGPALTPDTIIALLAAAAVCFVHCGGARISSWFQNTATVLKLFLITTLLIAGALVSHGGGTVTFLPRATDAPLLLAPAFATSLVYVMYAYSGWNAATYIVGEIRDPGRNIPRALLAGTIGVTVLYIALNAVFLHTTPMSELAGKVEIGLLAGERIFGPTGGKIVGGFICFGLIASCSAMTWVGSRVSATMGEDIRAFRWLAHRNPRGVPTLALIVQLLLVAVLILSATFEKVLLYIQFGLTLFSFASVLGLMVLRWREPDLPRPFRVPWYPFTPLVFLAISGWMLAYMLLEERTRNPSLVGLATILAGLIVYALSPKEPAVSKDSQ